MLAEFARAIQSLKSEKSESLMGAEVFRVMEGRPTAADRSRLVLPSLASVARWLRSRRAPRGDTQATQNRAFVPEALGTAPRRPETPRKTPAEVT